MPNSFRKKTDEHKRYYVTSGSRFENEYQEEIDKKTGRKVLKCIGKKDIYALIQSDLESTKIENILHKLAVGDLSVLRQAQLTYVDEKDFPKNLMEAQNIIIKTKQEFDKLPIEVKKLFNNSAEQYVSEMGTDEFIKKLSPFNDEIKKKYEADKESEFNAAVEEHVKFEKAVKAKMSEGDE